jgi:hypothetical protein
LCLLKETRRVVCVGWRHVCMRGWCAYVAVTQDMACRQIISDNGFNESITLIHGKVEDVELPVPKVAPKTAP